MDDELNPTGAGLSPDEWTLSEEDEDQETPEADNEETEGEEGDAAVQYDAGGFPIEDEEGQEPVAEAEPIAVVPARSKPSSLPPPSLVPMLSAEQQEELDELYITNPREATNRQFAYLMAQSQAQNRIGNHYVREFQASAPDFMESYGPRVQAIVEDVTRQNPNIGQDAVNLGVLGVVLEDSRANGNDIAKAIARANEKLNGKPVRPAPPAPKPLPAAQRVVSPSNSGASVRQPSTGSAAAGRQNARNGGAASNFLAKHFNLEPETAQGFASDLRRAK